VSCNREGPTNTSGRGLETITTKVMQENNNQFRYTVYLPPWLSDEHREAVKPFILICQDGNKKIVDFSMGDIQKAEPGWENYYRVDFVFDGDEEVKLLMTYGNYRTTSNDMKDWSFAILANKDSPYVVKYQPNNNRADDTYLIGMIFKDGQVSRLDNSLLVSLKAEIMIDNQVRTKVPAHFRAVDVQYTNILGLDAKNPFVWEFSDGFFGYGLDVWHTFERAGKKSVTLIMTDNLSRKDTVIMNFTVTD